MSPYPLLVHVLALLGVLGLGACKAPDASVEPGSSTAEQVTRAPSSLAPFERVRVSTALEVTLVQGPEHRVQVSGDARTLEHLRIDHTQGRVHVHLDGKLRKVGRVRVELSTPTLRELEVVGASEVELRGFGELAQLDLGLHGASELRSPDLGVGSLRMEVTGASELELGGKAKACGLSMTGASDAQLGQLQCTDWSVDASGACSAQIHATRSLGPVRLTGASDLSYSGGAQAHGLTIHGASSLGKL